MKTNSRVLLYFVAIVISIAINCSSISTASDRLNVVMVVLNDIGPGDLGCYGNRFAQTPNINSLFELSQRAENYHSYPTTAPTWASMLTGRNAEKTGVRRDFGGLQSPRTDDKLISELLAKSGFKTAFFGRWPFGDCCPYRPQDRGFTASLITGAGGIGQPGDAWGNSTINPTLKFNGKAVRLKGQMADIIFETAQKFIDKNQNNPFMVIIAPNEAGVPYQVPEKILAPFLQRGVPERQAVFYAQVSMIDSALGRLVRQLKESNLTKNTVIILTSTNGGIGGNIAGKFAGQKGEILEGGHRTIYWMCYPQQFKKNIGFNRICYCADVAPTILDLTGVPIPDEDRLDGMSLINGFRTGGESMPHRKVIVTSHRGEFPVEKQGAVVMHDQWRLLNGERLYNLDKDAVQEHPREKDEPGIKNVLAMFYKQWYDEVKPFYQPGQDCTIPLTNPEGSPVELNCFDWRGSDKPALTQQDIFARKIANGYWLVEVLQDGTYEFHLALRPFTNPKAIPAGIARLQIGTEYANTSLDGKKTFASIPVKLRKGQYKLQTWILDGQTRVSTGAYYVEVVKQ